MILLYVGAVILALRPQMELVPGAPCSKIAGRGRVGLVRSCLVDVRVSVAT